MAFVVLRQFMSTVQGILSVDKEFVSPQMMMFATALSRESIVDVEGIVCIPKEPIKGTTQQAGEQFVRVGQDTRLNYRVLDLRTPANQGIFRIQCHVEDVFRRFRRSEGFIGIHTPKLIAGSSERGAAVFKLEHQGQPACLVQSPQLHKQMVICGGFGRVFEVGHVFRAEDSYAHRHLCEFVGLDVEMETSLFPRDPRRLVP